MHHLKLISIVDLYSGVSIDQSRDVIRSKLLYADLKSDFKLKISYFFIKFYLEGMKYYFGHVVNGAEEHLFRQNQFHFSLFVIRYEQTAHSHSSPPYPLGWILQFRSRKIYFYNL